MLAWRMKSVLEQNSINSNTATNQTFTISYRHRNKAQGLDPYEMLQTLNHLGRARILLDLTCNTSGTYTDGHREWHIPEQIDWVFNQGIDKSSGQEALMGLLQFRHENDLHDRYAVEFKCSTSTHLLEEYISNVTQQWASQQLAYAGTTPALLPQKQTEQVQVVIQELFDEGYSTADVPIRYADLHPDMNPLLTLLWMARCNKIEIMELLPTHARITPTQGLISLKTSDPITAKPPKAKVLIMRDPETSAPVLRINGKNKKPNKGGFPWAFFSVVLDQADLDQPITKKRVETQLGRKVEDMQKALYDMKPRILKNADLSTSWFMPSTVDGLEAYRISAELFEIMCTDKDKNAESQQDSEQ